MTDMRTVRHHTLTALFLALALSAPLAADAKAPTAVVLTYHVVESPSDTHYSMTREAFRLQMEYLRSTGYEVISLADLTDYVNGRRESIPQNSVVITVDDGWKCTYTEIFPVMQEMGFPFTIFIYPNWIGKSAYALTWSEIREMSDAGVDVQSHSNTHPFLTRRSAEALRTELVASKHAIEEQTGKPVRFLAYPYGDYNARVAKATEEAGYEAGLTCNFGAVEKGSNPFVMKRVVIYEKTSFAEFRKYLGTEQLRLAEAEPRPGQTGDSPRPVISARIEGFESLDPSTVNLALLGSGRMPFTYDPRNGRVSLVTREGLAGKRVRAAVWGIDAETGKRREAIWSFTIPKAPSDTILARESSAGSRRNSAAAAGSAVGSGQK